MHTSNQIIGGIYFIVGATLFLVATYDLLWRVASILLGLYCMLYGLKTYQPKTVQFFMAQWGNRFK